MFEFSFFFAFHDGRKLVEVADEQELDAAERLSEVGSDGAEAVVDGVEEVGAEHAYFVDDEQVDGAEDLFADAVEWMSFGEDGFGVPVSAVGGGFGVVSVWYEHSEGQEEL